MKKKLISILITNYNKQKFINKCLRSVSKQTFKNFEIILFDDCSSDNSSNLVPIMTEVACGIRNKLIVNGNDYNTHDGTCIRDYIHVQDLAIAHVKALDFLLENKVKEVFNVGTGIGLSVLVVTATLLGHEVKLHFC